MTRVPQTKLALNKPNMTPSKIPNARRGQYFFKYGQQNEYNLEMLDTAMSRPRGNERSISNQIHAFLQSKTLDNPAGVAICSG